MAGFRRWHKLATLIRMELSHLMTIHPSNRVWQMPFAAALATGLPLLIGAYFGRMDYGLISSLGGLVFLYLPGTLLYHRMVSLLACAFGMVACYALGVMSQFFAPAMMPVLIFTTILVTMICRFYGLGPPGSLFFVMAAAIGAYSPTTLMELPTKIGLITMGCLLACLIGFLYSLLMLRSIPPKPVAPLSSPEFGFVVLDSVVIGVFVGISLALAQALQLEKAYWVPVSCLAVIQGATLRAIWVKQVHRVLGTAIGLLVALGVFLLPLDAFSIALMVMALTFIVEFTVVRHYAIAAIFITPLTILLAEAATLGHGSAASLVQARFIDTALGCFVGLAGGICLHIPRFRERVDRLIRYLIPSRLVR